MELRFEEKYGDNPDMEKVRKDYLKYRIIFVITLILGCILVLMWSYLIYDTGLEFNKLMVLLCFISSISTIELSLTAMLRMIRYG